MSPTEGYVLIPRTREDVTFYGQKDFAGAGKSQILICGDNPRLSAGPNATRSGYTVGGDEEGERERDPRMEEEATGQGRQVASVSWKRRGNVSLRAS